MLIKSESKSGNLKNVCVHLYCRSSAAVTLRRGILPTAMIDSFLALSHCPLTLTPSSSSDYLRSSRERKWRESQPLGPPSPAALPGISLHVLIGVTNIFVAVQGRENDGASDCLLKCGQGIAIVLERLIYSSCMNRIYGNISKSVVDTKDTTQLAQCAATAAKC